MKMKITYFLLVAFIWSQVSGIGIILWDKIEHAINLTEHIAVVHVENGKKHLHVELKKSEQSKSKNSNTQKQLKLEILPQVLIKGYDFIYNLPLNKGVKNFWCDVIINSIYIEILVPPPNFL